MLTKGPRNWKSSSTGLYGGGGMWQVIGQVIACIRKWREEKEKSQNSLETVFYILRGLGVFPANSGIYRHRHICLTQKTKKKKYMKMFEETVFSSKSLQISTRGGYAVSRSTSRYYWYCSVSAVLPRRPEGVGIIAAWRLCSLSITLISRAHVAVWLPSV